MEDHSLNDKEVILDIDSFVNGYVDNTNNNDKKSLAGEYIGFDGTHENVNVVRLSGGSDETVGLLVENEKLVEEKNEKGRGKTGKVKKKAAKPPRPPKGPSLDAADMKLVKEISERAMKKRERIERIKAFKKMKVAKASASSPSGSSISALVITVLFFIVIIFQGLGYRNRSHVTLRGAPEPAMETKGLISVQLYNSVPSNDDAGQSSASPRFAKEEPGLEFRYPG